MRTLRCKPTPQKVLNVPPKEVSALNAVAMDILRDNVVPGLKGLNCSIVSNDNDEAVINDTASVLIL